MSVDKDANDFLMQTGGKSFRFEKVSDVVIGEVVSAQVAQQTDLDTQEKLSWPDGTPRMQLVITLQTALKQDAEDDGVRTIYAKGGKYDVAEGEGLSMKEAISKAVRDGGGTGLNPGDQLAVAYTGNGVKKNRGFTAPKLYEASWKKAVPASVSGKDLFGDDGPF